MNKDEKYELIEPSSHPWQDTLIGQLLIHKEQGKLPHALIIELDTQVDSRSFGWKLAMTLLCHSPIDSNACGQCKSCQLMLANSYPDFTFTTIIENERTSKLNKNISVEQIRQLIHKVSLTNNFQNGKIALIYPAEKLNESSSNSLLKTLEEPSDEATLILLTHHASRLPITIRSRCQQWNIKNPESSDAITWLQKQGADIESAKNMLAMAHNDAELALELLAQGYQQTQEKFKQSLNLFYNNQLNVVTLIKELGTSDNDLLRLIIKTELIERIQTLSLQQLTPSIKLAINSLLDLILISDKTLKVEDNNLILQLQLEDVLLSMKHINNKD